MDSDMSSAPNILIVEDEMLVAMDIEAIILDANWKVIGPVPDVPQALSMLQTKPPDAVCLDMNLNGVPSTPIVDALNKLGIPFVVVTGYSTGKATDPAYGGAPIVHKPFTAAELLQAVKQAMR
jgi:two-component system, response regulator PdtaR